MLIVALVACSSKSTNQVVAPACTPGATEVCACNSGSGTQVCNKEGTGFESCQCGGSGGSSAGGTGGSSGGSTGGSAGSSGGGSGSTGSGGNGGSAAEDGSAGSGSGSGGLGGDGGSGGASDGSVGSGGSGGGGGVFQPGETIPLPRPVGQSEIDVTRSRGWSESTQIYFDFNGTLLNPPKVYTEFFPNFEDGDAVKLSGLFKWRSESIDEVRDALSGPGYFSPGCGFSAEILVHGGSCDMQLGWYNVAAPTDPPPAATEIHPILPAGIETAAGCLDQTGAVMSPGSGFCPLGWDHHHPFNLRQIAWISKAYVHPLTNDPNYRGGSIAFALVGAPGGRCQQTKYSVAAHNVKSSQYNQPWITVLIYRSTATPNAFYLAFEDLPMTPASWKESGVAGQQSDGDFNDLVFIVNMGVCQ